jgi:LPS-assembly lipoprotein
VACHGVDFARKRHTPLIAAGSLIDEVKTTRFPTMFEKMTATKLSFLPRLLLMMVLINSLSACGFHLRGNIPLSESIKNMYVSAPNGTFKDQLEEVLLRAGANLAENKASADVVLNVKKVESDRLVGTLDARGKANSYTLRLKVAYALEDTEGKKIRKVKRLNESRQYNFNPEQVVESESEEAELMESMERDAALQVVRQLSTVTDYQPN